jgi:diguanylate cyclase (GGDEF)-like protein
MDSKVALIVELAGVFMITLLTLFLRRTLKFVALRHWANAWLLLGCGLFCLRLAFGYEQYSQELFSFYFLCEYIFGFLLVAGCRSLGKGEALTFRNELLIIPLAGVAFALPFTSGDLSVVMNAHSLILSVFFVTAFVELYRTKIGSFGWRVMLIALGLMSLDLLQSVIVYTLGSAVIPDALISYNAVIDLVLQMMLGFGMVIVLLELVLSDVKTANEKLKKAHEKLEELAHIDPLTTALNRHAFHGYLKRRGSDFGPASGTVGFFDIDDLKAINDEFGHAVGDAAIRLVVRAIREVIRAEDLIFRWGGDEFFVLMVGLDADGATARMERLESLLTNVSVDGVYPPLTIGVSRAFSDFTDISNLEATVADADVKMYQQKQLRKRMRAVCLPQVAVELPHITQA